MGQRSTRIVPGSCDLSSDWTAEILAGYVKWTIYPAGPIAEGVARVSYEVERTPHQLVVHFVVHQRTALNTIVMNLAVDDDSLVEAR